MGLVRRQEPVRSENSWELASQGSVTLPRGQRPTYWCTTAALNLEWAFLNVLNNSRSQPQTLLACQGKVEMAGRAFALKLDPLLVLCLCVLPT